MSRDKHRCDSCRHEGYRGDEGTHREPRKPAHAMTGRTPVAPYRTETDKESGDSENDGTGLDGLGWESSGDGKHNNRRRHKPRYKSQPPGEFIVGVGRQQANRDATDAGNSPANRHQHDGGEADQRAAGERGNWREDGGNHCVVTMIGIGVA